MTLFPIRRVAIIYNDVPRPETTGGHVLRSLERIARAGELEAVVHVLPGEIERLIGQSFDLYLVIDDGFGCMLPPDFRPSAYWTIDTHVNFEPRLAQARAFDFVFAAQKNGAERLRQAGIATARWLPLACDPEIHGKQDVPKQYDLAFVGNLFPGPRTDLLERLRRKYRNVWIGNAYFQEMARIHSSALRIFNCCIGGLHRDGDLNMRTFEALASGSPLITNDLGDNGQDELFVKDQHLITYASAEELFDKLAFYDARPELYERIAATGRAEVLARHTYEHRVREMLAVVARRAGGVSPLFVSRQDVIACQEPGVRSQEGGRTGESSKEKGESGQEAVGSGQEAVSSQDIANCKMQIANCKLGNDQGQVSPHPSLLTNHRDPSYFDFGRDEVVALISQDARTVLDAGCASGRTGELLKQRQPCEVVGIEIDPKAAEIARTRLDRVIVGDMETLELDFADGHFDCIVFADSLEHMADSRRQLRRVRPWLAPGGHLILSIPNVRHHSVVCALLDGNFSYEPAGITDDTHQAFYTLRTIKKLLAECGFAIEQVAAVPGPRYDEWQQAGQPGKITIGKLHLEGPVAEIQEFFVYQWLVVATPMANRDEGERKKEKGESGPEAAGSGQDGERSQEPGARSQEEDGSGQEAVGSWEAGERSQETGDRRQEAAGSGQAEAEASNLQFAICNLQFAIADVESLPHAPPPLLTRSGPTCNPQSAIRNPQSFPPCLLLMITYNRLEYTKPALESVLGQDYPNLIVVVWDNASTDGSVEYLQERLRGESRARLIASPVNRGVVYPMNAVWFSDHGAELLAKVDNDTCVPSDLLLRLAEWHAASDRFGVLSGFHFREQGEALVDEGRVETIEGMRVVRQEYVGGCAIMVKKATLDRLGPIACRGDARQAPFMDSGWTAYQERMTEAGYINGYPWPPLHVDHMEDTRSRRCIRTPEHEAYKQALRGMSLQQFTDELCVWRPHWEGSQETGVRRQEGGEGTGYRAQGIGEDGGTEDAGTRGRGDTEKPQSTSTPTRSASKAGPQSGRNNVPTQSRPAERVPRTRNPKSRLRFTQDFRRDFEQFDFFGPPFAFSRFGDGERAICTGRPIEGTDGWTYAGGASPFREALLAALRFADADYYIGLSDGCCDPEAKAWFLREVRLPLSQVTFANVFVNGNYARFRQLDLDAAVLVASQGGDYKVPDDVMNSNFDIDRLVERLLTVKRPILVAAGPASGIIIHRYWQRAKPDQRQVIVDVGSAIDELTKGRKTRGYQVPGTRTAELVCTW